MGENAPGERIDVRERGGDRDGIPQILERRLFMQLMVFESDKKLSPADSLRSLAAVLTRRNVPSVVYEDVNDPHGLGVLTWSEEPLDFTDKVRPVFGEPETSSLS